MMEQKVKTANELTLMWAFRDVLLEAPFDVVIGKTGTCSAYVECDEADMDKIDVYVENGTLHIKTKGGTTVINETKPGLFGRIFGHKIVQTQKSGDNSCQIQINANGSVIACNNSVISINGDVVSASEADVIKSKVKVHVGMPIVRKLTVEGSGNIEVDDVPFDEWSICTLCVSGSGDIDVNDIVTDTVRMIINGSGDITVKDIKAKTLDATISGSGDITVKNATAKDVNNTINGSGDITYKNLSKKNMTNRVNGSGDVNY